MVGLGLAMKITTPAGAALWSTRDGCLAAEITVAGINYLLASREPGNRDCVDLVLAVDEPDRAMLAAALRAARPGEESSIEVHLATPSQTHTFDVSIQDLNRCAPVRGLDLTAHDVTDQQTLQREIEYRALHDFLTGLPNRVLLADRCSTALREDVPRSRSRTSRSAWMPASAWCTPRPTAGT